MWLVAMGGDVEVQPEPPHPVESDDDGSGGSHTFIGSEPDDEAGEGQPAIEGADPDVFIDDGIDYEDQFHEEDDASYSVGDEDDGG